MARHHKQRQALPAGWNEARVQAVLHHYEQQTEDEALAEDEQYPSGLQRRNLVFRKALGGWLKRELLEAAR